MAHKALLVSTSTEAKKDDIPCAAQSIQTVVVASPAKHVSPGRELEGQQALRHLLNLCLNKYNL